MYNIDKTGLNVWVSKCSHDSIPFISDYDKLKFQDVAYHAASCEVNRVIRVKLSCTSAHKQSQRVFPTCILKVWR